ncbi:tyrosine-type recombinase/integrase [Acinetobacter haemolyticus]|uniref:tyrosine-type recombinase/integrase n=1 Tax=Acinetobacter haemolyticus TaxID=29430 RepID=UPI003F5642E4
MLNDTKIKQLKAQDKIYRVADQGGLCIEVRPNGSKLWRFRYRFLGTAKMISLGEYPIVTLAQARQKTLDQKSLLDQNIDPSQNKQIEKSKAKMNQECLFENIANEWYEKRKDRRSESYRRSTEKAFKKDIFPSLGKKDIKNITAVDVLKMQEKTMKRVVKQKNYGTGEATAILNRQLVSQILDYAIATSRCEYNPISSLRNTIERPTKQTARPMTDDEKLVFNERMKKYKGAATTKNAIMALMYSMLRSVEIIRLQWSWVNLENDLIRIPPATKEQLEKGQRNIKKDREHLVPVSKQLKAILLEQYKQTKNGELVFSSVFDLTKQMNKTTINSALDKMGLSDLTAHDFRATASTILHDLGYPSDHVELQLAHVDKNIVRGTYNHASYLEERRKMMQDWADIVDSWGQQ